MHDRALSSAARPSAAAGAGSDRAGWLRTHWQELLRLLLGSVARTIHLLLYVLPLVGDGAENSKPTYLQELQAHVCVPATTWLAFGGSRWPTWWPVASSVTQPVLSHLVRAVSRQRKAGAVTSHVCVQLQAYAARSPACANHTELTSCIVLL
jgi:hypothetical protein